MNPDSLRHSLDPGAGIPDPGLPDTLVAPPESAVVDAVLPDSADRAFDSLGGIADVSALDILFTQTMIKIFALILGTILIVIAIRLIRRTLIIRLNSPGTRYRARKVADFFGYMLFILLVVIIFESRLGGLSVTLGIIGAGIAFALQEVIASIAGWFAITFANFFDSGDRVQFGGIKGDVIDIGILRTTVMEVGEWVDGDLYSGRVVRIANSFIFKEPVFNYSGEFPFLWDEIKLKIRYGSDYALTRAMLKDIVWDVTAQYTEGAKRSWRTMVTRFMVEDAQVDPMISMTMDENWATFTIRYVVDYKRRRSTKDQLFTRILAAIDASENRILIATAALNLNVIRDVHPEAKADSPDSPGDPGRS